MSAGMIDLSEQGLAQLERAVMFYKWPVFAAAADAREKVLALISALRQARADLREARELLEKAQGYFVDDALDQQIDYFLSRTVPREGGE